MKISSKDIKKLLSGICIPRIQIRIRIWDPDPLFIFRSDLDLDPDPIKNLMEPKHWDTDTLYRTGYRHCTGRGVYNPTFADLGRCIHKLSYR